MAKQVPLVDYLERHPESLLRGKPTQLDEPPRGERDHGQASPEISAGELDEAVRENVSGAIAD